jgi:hypothetical protein
MERNTKILDNENRSKREGSTEKYKQHEWAKGTLTLFIVSRKSMSAEKIPH